MFDLNWFNLKYPPIASCGNPNANLLSDSADSITNSYLARFRSLLLQYSVEFRSYLPIGWQCSAHNSYSNRWLRRGLGAFFIYRHEQKTKEREKAENRPQLLIEYDKDDKNTFQPAITYYDERGKPIHSIKDIKVRIRNNGGGVARNCKAKAKIIESDAKGFVAADDWKPLTWNGPSNKMDIGVNDDEITILTFSDSLLDGQTSMQIHALIATMESRYPKVLGSFRNQDGVGVGSFKVRLVVISEDGASATAIFRIKVADKWETLDADRIS